MRPPITQQGLFSQASRLVLQQIVPLYPKPLAGCLLLLLLTPCLVLSGKEEDVEISPLRKRALERYDAAIQAQTLLESKPQRLRNAAEYSKVIEIFRSVYFTCPASSKADDALFAVGELSQKMGTEYRQSQYFQRAIKAFTFLSKEYPASPLSERAAFSIGEIYWNDLKDAEAAKEAFEDFVVRYPGSPKVRNARARLEDLTAELKPRQRQRLPLRETESEAVGNSEQQAKEAGAPELKSSATKQSDRLTVKSADSSTFLAPSPRMATIGKPAVVKEARYWHSVGYTRLVISLDSEARFLEGRIDKPDRVYLDIQNTHFSAPLLNKTLFLGKGLPRVRTGQPKNDVSRIVLEGDALKGYHIFTLKNPFRIVIDLQSSSQVNSETRSLPVGIPEQQSAPPSDELLVASRFELRPRLERNEPPTDKLEAAKKSEQGVAESVQAHKLLKAEPSSSEVVRNIGVAKPTSSRSESGNHTKDGTATASVARPKSDGTRSLIRTLGLKIGRIVIDPGHGGHDTGTIGPSGLMEKDLVLDVSLKLKTLIEEKLGGEVILTRQDDTFIPLEGRTELANLSQADLFISIHANSSRDKAVRGVETFFLDFTSSPNSEEVAARENASSQKTIFELQDLVKRIALREKIDESREFAQVLQKAVIKQIQRNPQTTNRGVKQAPFIVLIGAQMPSILTEVSFLSNPSDEKLLKTTGYRLKVAQAICNGIEDYTRNLGGIKTASNLR